MSPLSFTKGAWPTGTGVIDFGFGWAFFVLGFGWAFFSGVFWAFFNVL